jgi:probable FeS assembly SUF system protein SufT
MSHQEVELTRDIEAIRIPSGDPITLPAGLRVIITQALGGTYTVATETGLARISAANADALGIDKVNEKEKASSADSSNIPSDATELERKVWGQMKGVFDPEIPVNIVDLGLVYDCAIVDQGDSRSVEVKMTLTAPGCGMGPTIAADAQARITALDEIDEAKVELVWDPPWNQGMISEEGKMTLGMI